MCVKLPPRDLNSGSCPYTSQTLILVKWPPHQESAARFWNPDWTVRSDRENREPLTITVLLSLRTGLCQKSREPFELRFNRTVLRTVIKPLLTIPFESEPKKKKNTHTHTQRKTKEKETQLLGRTNWFDFASLSKNVSNNPNIKYKTKSNSYNKVESEQANMKKKKEKRTSQSDPIWWGGGGRMVVGRQTR